MPNNCLKHSNFLVFSNLWICKLYALWLQLLLRKMFYCFCVRSFTRRHRTRIPRTYFHQCPEFSIISIRASYMKPLWGIFEINMKQLWRKFPWFFQKMKCWVRQFYLLPNHYKTGVIDSLIDICQGMHCNSKKFALKLNQK